MARGGKSSAAPDLMRTPAKLTSNTVWRRGPMGVLWLMPSVRRRAGGFRGVSCPTLGYKGGATVE